MEKANKTLTNLQVRDAWNAFTLLGKPYRKPCDDGKSSVETSYARDMPPSVNYQIGWNWKALKPHFMALEDSQAQASKTIYGDGKPEEAGREKQIAFADLWRGIMKETMDVEQYQIKLSDKKVDDSNCIDLSKCVLPQEVIADLLDVCFVWAG